MSPKACGEGMRLARLLMVLSSISPIFILWGIRGSPLIPDTYFIPICVALVVIPNAFLWLRIQTARKLNEKRELVVGGADDHREHLLVYLFAMLLPFYGTDLSAWRDFVAVLVALGFIVFLFWHMNLHYMNLLFATFSYRVFMVTPPPDNNSLTDRSSLVIITHRSTLSTGEKIVAYRLSNTVYLEGG